ncbi:MAG TPA: lysophospholipid acyltransferase family protein [Clostridia bacterium]|nr:lysophospholipid acyltransferase family protein [Clostridia bacterium]
MKNYNRHVLIYKILRFVLSPFFKLKFAFKYKPTCNLKPPYLVLCNHNTDYDPILLGISFPQFMYFVASEHIYRWGTASKLLNWCFSPIARLKGTTDARTVMEVLRRLRAGFNICIFAEGNRSFNGLTCDILPSTAKLVKASGVSLVTFKLEGGYFTSPRWSTTLRRGKMYGYAAGVYTAEQLKSMTVAEVDAIIKNDLYEDAYKRQESSPVRFVGKRLAEELETALYLCPACKRIGTLHSKDALLKCDCGLQAVYAEYGCLEGTGIQFSTITQWDVWQTQELLNSAQAAGEEPIVSDVEQSLFRVDPGVSSTLITKDALYMFKDRLTCGEYSFPLGEITDMAIYGQRTLVFSTDKGIHYEIKSDYPRSAIKYLLLFRHLKQ